MNAGDHRARPSASSSDDRVGGPGELAPFITWVEDLTALLVVELEEAKADPDDLERRQTIIARARYALALAHLLSTAMGSDHIPPPPPATLRPLHPRRAPG